MPYVSAEAIERARNTDLLTWLQYNEPGNLVKLSGDNYCTREHDSLKISNGKWHWFSRGIGGKSALDYLIQVKEYSFPQAVEAIVGGAVMKTPPFSYVPKEQKLKRLLMPEIVSYPENAKTYLSGRGIHSVIIDYCIEHSLLFETANYHNAVFIGYDSQGVARYAAMRGTKSAYKGEVTGSDKHFSFSIAENINAMEVHLFESAIDLLSFATLELFKGHDWKQHALLSLAGVFKTKRKDVVPVALSRFLEDHPKIKTIHLHLDNDEVGRGAAQGIINGLSGKYLVLDEPPAQGKDVNEELMLRVGLRKNKEEIER
jgi:hypothetical protein